MVKKSCLLSDIGSFIETIQESDLDEVTAIESGSFNPPWTRNMFQEELSNSSAYAFVYRPKNRIMAYMIVRKVVNECHLFNIAVHPEMRSQGVGFRLLEHLQQMCIDMGLKKILLEVARGNKAARSLYGKAGFISTGFRRMYYPGNNDDAILMEKDI